MSNANPEGWTQQHGDILITRNYDEADNRTPGYWNHAAIYWERVETAQHVIEAQPAPGAVIMSDWGEFYHRYSEILLLRHNSNAVRLCMAGQAYAMLGTKYRWMDTINRRMRNPFKRGVNCLGVVRRAYRNCSGYDPRWHRPDHVVDSAVRCGFWIARIKPLPR